MMWPTSSVSKWMVFGIVLAFGASPAWSQAPVSIPGKSPPPGIKAPPGPSAPAPVPGVPQGPRIAQFEQVSDAVYGEPVPLRWRVEPGVSGSPVQRVLIIDRELYVGRDLPASGERSFPLARTAGAAPGQLTLRATDAAGKTAEKPLSLRFVSPREALDRLGIEMESNPVLFQSGARIDLRVRLASGYAMSGLNLVVSHEGRVVANLPGVAVTPPAFTGALSEVGDLRAATGTYEVRISYGGQTLTKRFETIVAPVPLHTFRAASP